MSNSSVPSATRSMAIVGAGITDLVCDFRLQARVVPVTVYEAGDRPGGGIQSTRGRGSSPNAARTPCSRPRPRSPGGCSTSASNRAVVGSLKHKSLNREVFHGQTWNYRQNGELFLMNGYCYAIYGDRPKPNCYVAEQEDVTELETHCMKPRLRVNPNDGDALRFYSVLDEWKSGWKKA